MWKHEVVLFIVTLIQFIHILKGENVAKCAKNEFTCKDGECILAKWRCDGEADCLDTSDEEHCKSYPSCSSDEFRCNTSKECIDDTWKCDGVSDCADQSDELNCDHLKCSDAEYRCASGFCILPSYVCDGDNDCPDSSDEVECALCKKNQFRCHAEKRCITLRWRCDYDKDCLNGEDELNCTYSECLPEHWKCGSGECIAKRYRCDQDSDCQDWSDEMKCGNLSIICDEKTQFQCASGECTKLEWVCDGHNDCYDGTDEYNCSNDKVDCVSRGRGKNNCTTTVQSNSTNPCPRERPYRCETDQCIEAEKVCNRVADCKDGSDEFRCPTSENQTSCGINRGECHHLCHDHGSSFSCSCYEGFEKKKNDPKSCKDKDECEIFGYCSQECVNGIGTYNCSCLKGYILQSDGRKCNASGSKPLFLLSNENEIMITKLETQSKMQTLVDNLESSVAVDYCLEQNLVFWTDTVLRTIKSARLDGTMIKDVVKFGLKRPCDLAVDWLGEKLFWADSESGRIEMSNFDGAQRKALFWVPLGRLRAIALHPSKGYLFWTEWDVGEDYSKSSIARANMDGTGMRRILYQDVHWPNAIVVDYVTQRIFFVDAKLKDGLIAIESSNFAGKKRRTTTIAGHSLQPFSLSIFEDTLYWTDTASKAIYKANKFDGQGFGVVRRNVKSPMGIAVLHTTRQPRDSYNCGNDNGGCSHICLPKSTGRSWSCTCPTGYKMLNSTHCSERINKFVAYVGDCVVSQISLDTDDMLDVVLPFQHVLDVLAMDWDPIADEMYWADIKNDEISIRKGKMRPPYHEALVHKISGKLSGFGIDWLSTKLYWSDEERNHILVSNFDGSSTTVLLWWKKNKPRNLLLHVEKRYMYWTSHGSVVSINQAGMDGFSRKKIVSNGLVNPTDLTLDKATNFLYWVDGGDIINYISMTTRKRNFFKVSYHSKTLSPFSIGVYGGRLFWADSNLKKILFLKLGDKNDAEVIGKYKSNPMRLAVFEKVENQGIHPCTVKNGDCSHLCLLSPSQDLRCACPTGRHLKADNKTCETATEISRFVLVNSNGRLHQVPLNVSYKAEIMIASAGNRDIFAFDFDVKHRYVYFIKNTNSKKEICYVSLYGGNHTCIFSDILRAPGDIAYDPVRHNIYWTDFLTKKIYLADHQGKFWTVIIWKYLDLPSSVTVAYKHGFIFWADLGKQISISRANMDGSAHSKIVTSGMKWPNSLTVDHVTAHLYWTDYLEQRIELCDFNGKNRRQFASISSGPTSLTLFSKFVYWSELQPRVLRKSSKVPNGHATTVIKGLKRVTGIQAVNLRKIPVSKSKCAQNNGNCSHFCLNNPARISCACPVGLNLQHDGRTCYDSPRRAVLYTSGKSMRRISLDTDDLTSFLLTNIYPNITANFALDIMRNRLYWTDGTSIYSTITDGSESKTLFTAATSSIRSLTVDWISGNLFWTDFMQAKIKVSNLNGSLRADLISAGLEKPRDIVVDPVKGFLFWTDTGKRVIERAYTDGQSRVVIISRDINQPVGLIVDVNTGFLYWTDSMYHTIERCSYDGQKRFTLVNKDVHAFGLAVLGSHVYWTDQRQRALLRVDKETGNQLDVLEEDLETPMAVASLSIEKMPELSPCFKNNGNCSSLCLSSASGRRSCASVCGKEVHLKDSCEVQEIATKPTSVKPSTSCKLVDGNESCFDGSINNVTEEEKELKVAYIVGGIVFLAFIITMSILVFLCRRRLRSRPKPLMPLKVSFEIRRVTSKEDSVNDPLVTIYSIPDQVSTTSNPPSSKEGFAVSYQVKNGKKVQEENQCLTIANV